MAYTTKITEQLNEGVESHSFGVSDKKGREIGATVRFEVRVYEEFTPTERTYFRTDIAPGTYFMWIGRATRAGETFGSGEGFGFCKTEAERHAAVEKYLKGAKARALKTASN